MPHIHDKIDFTVEVYIVHNDKVLLRKHDKYSLWLSVGGHIELDEDPNQAALREVKEEVGLEVQLYEEDSHIQHNGEGYTELISPQFMNIHDINDSHKHISLIYFARSKTDKLILSETEKSEDCKWFTQKELDNSNYDIKDYVKRCARDALSKVLQK